MSNREALNETFTKTLTAHTGYDFTEVVLMKDTFSIMGSEEAINSVEKSFTNNHSKEYDEDYQAWFIQVGLDSNIMPVD